MTDGVRLAVALYQRGVLNTEACTTAVEHELSVRKLGELCNVVVRFRNGAGVYARWCTSNTTVSGTGTRRFAVSSKCHLVRTCGICRLGVVIWSELRRAYLARAPGREKKAPTSPLAVDALAEVSA